MKAKDQELQRRMCSSINLGQSYFKIAKKKWFMDERGHIYFNESNRFWTYTFLEKWVIWNLTELQTKMLFSLAQLSRTEITKDIFSETSCSERKYIYTKENILLQIFIGKQLTMAYSKTDNLIRNMFKTHLSLVLQTHLFVWHRRIADNGWCI